MNRGRRLAFRVPRYWTILNQVLVCNAGKGRRCPLGSVGRPEVTVATFKEGLLALSFGVGLAVVHEIFQEEVGHLVGRRGKHHPGSCGSPPRPGEAPGYAGRTPGRGKQAARSQHLFILAWTLLMRGEVYERVALGRARVSKSVIPVR